MFKMLLSLVVCYCIAFLPTLLSIEIKNLDYNKRDTFSNMHPANNNGSCDVGDPVFCRCDSLCHTFGDCCEEIILQQLLLHKNALKSRPGITCILHNSAISNCPKISKFNIELRNNCEFGNSSLKKIQFYLPVYTKSGKLYRNAHCALCNGEKSFIPVKSKYYCRSSDTAVKSINDAINNLNNRKCRFFHKIPKSVHRQCFLKTIASCPPNTTAKMAETCSNGSTWNSYDKRGIHYKNPACCECNGVQCFEYHQGVKRPQGFMGSRVSYEVILDFAQWCGDKCEAKQNNNDTFDYQYKETTDAIFAVLTRICCTLSFIALGVLIVAYSFTPDLHNFGGLLTLSLACTVLVTLVVFLLAPLAKDSGSGCVFVAALLHYLYLSCFAWMALFSVDLLRTFYGTNRPTIRPLVRFAKFSAAGFGIPLVIVVICSFLNAFVPDSSFSPAYGTHLCWFNSVWGGLIWFFIPVALVLVFNTGSCIACFCHFFRTARETREVRGENYKQSMMCLCIKITALFGISWVLQVITVIIQVDLLTRIVGLFNSLHGLFISLCFLLTKRVRGVTSDSFRRVRMSFKGSRRPTGVSENNVKEIKMTSDMMDDSGTINTS